MNFLFFLNFCVNIVIVANEVITLIKDNNIICVLTDDSVNSSVYISSTDKFIHVNRQIQEISSLNDWTVSNDVTSFTPISDQRWIGFSIIDNVKKLKLKNVLIFSLCLDKQTLITIATNDDTHNITLTIPFEFNTYPNFCQWNHFILKKHFNENQGNITLLNATNGIKDTKNISEDMSLVITTSEVKYVKLHKYSFFIAQSVSAYKSGVNVNNWKCVSFYVSIDTNCYLNITLASKNQVIEEWQIKGFNNIGKIKLWKHFTFPLKEIEAKFLTFQRIRNDNKIDGFWAIDEIRECNSELVVYKQTVQNSTGLLNYTCKTLESINPISSNKPCNSSQTIGTLCNIKCSDILGQSASNCEKHKICIENNCYCARGYTGNSCNTQCDGEQVCGCNVGCEDCDYMKRCDKCKDKYFGNYCAEKLPILQKPPQLVDLGDNYIQIKFFLEYGEGEKRPNFYVIEYKKFNSSDNFQMFEKNPYPLIKTIITNITLPRIHSYQIRILLETEQQISYKKNLPELIIYAQSLHSEISDDNTLTLIWDKPHNVSFEKYILEFKCSSFCSNSDFNKTLYNTSYTMKINSLPCTVKLFIEADNNSLIDTTVISKNAFPITDEELPNTIELNKDKILFTMEACESFTEPLDYIAVITCLDSWCEDKNSTTKLSFKNYNKTLAKQIENLYPYTLYEVKVTAKRSGQKDKVHTYSNITSFPSKLEQVKDLVIYNVQKNVIAIKWLADYPPKGKIEKYNIILVDNNGFVIESSNSTWSCKLWDNYTCGNLTISTLPQNYNISVSRKNYNVTEWSTPLFVSGVIKNVTTLPINLKAVFNNFSKILSLSWEHPLYVYGKIDSFLIEINNNTSEEKITTYQKKYNKTINIQCEKSYNISVWANTGSNSSKSNIVHTCDEINNFKKPETTLYNQTSTNEKIKPSDHKKIVQSKLVKIVIISVITVIVISLLLILWTIRVRKKKKISSKQKKERECIELSNISEVHVLVEINNENIQDITKPIHMNNLEQYIILCLENPKDNDIINQFKGVPKSKTTDCKVGLLVKNLHKNRYPNIIPYDENRVVLIDNEKSDYINASYINGYNKPKSLIATQAPLESTIHDFWQMVCQEKCEVIVMLNKLEENGNMTSERYWPLKKSKFRYGKFLVENVATTVTSCCRHSNLIVKFDNIEHVVQHYQYMSWPEEGIPPNIKSFNNLLEEIIALSTKNPIIVHCNDGCGRTGVFILCYIMIEMAMKEKCVDYPKILKQIRNQRCYLVANIEQYIFCYIALAAYVCKRNFSIKISNNFQNEIEKALKIKYLELLLMRLEITKEQYSNVELLLSEENKSKNRFSKILPGQSQIVLRSSLTNSSNYINAITVDSYLYPGKFIVTQQPLPNTIADFWKLIEKNEINIIISLNEIFENDSLCPRFWPNNIKPAMDFTTTELRFLNNATKCDTYDVINVKIKIAEHYEKTVSIVDLKIWKRETLKPLDPTHLIRLWKKYVANSQKIVVMCYDGATASGLFVALAYMLEEIDTKHICDIFHAVKSVREYRPQFVQDLEQLEFLYKAALIYITEMTNKKSLEMYVQNYCS